MDKYEHRRIKLLELRDTLCDGKNVNLANKLGKDETYVSRMLYAPEKKGRKRIGDDMLDTISQAFNVPKSWLDGSDVNIQLGNSFGSNNTFGNNNNFGNSHLGGSNTYSAHHENACICKANAVMPDDSLSPVITRNSNLHVDNQVDEIIDGKIYLIEFGGVTWYRRLFKLPNNQVAIKVFNSAEFSEYTATLDDVKIIGRVTQWLVND